MKAKEDFEYEQCTRCGKRLYRSKSKRKGRPFCSRQCHMKTMNEELNPGRMTPETRSKLREARLNTGKGLSYEKYFGRHAHRVLAEAAIGRPLRPGEVVHHLDGDRRNNKIKNLMVFATQAEHAAWHALHDEKR